MPKTRTASAPKLPLCKHLARVALGLTLGFGVACDEGSEPCAGSCDALCVEAGFDSVDEASLDGALSCMCSGGGGTEVGQEACENFCVGNGGTADGATVNGGTCTCTGIG